MVLPLQMGASQGGLSGFVEKPIQEDRRKTVHQRGIKSLRGRVFIGRRFSYT
jgi:hypothetical protein